MSEKIIVLDDQSILSRALIEALEKDGYSLLLPRALDPFRAVLHERGAGLVVHISRSPRLFSPYLAELRALAPDLPVLHVSDESLVRSQNWVQGPFQDWLPSTVSASELLRRVSVLLHFGSIDRELRETKSFQDKATAFANRIARLDMSILIDEVMAFFAGELGCDNVVWYPSGALRQDLEAFLTEPRDLGTVRKVVAPRWKTLRALPAPTLAPIYEAWLPLPGFTPEFENHVHELRGAQGSDVILPIADGGQDRLLGHLLFVAPKRWKRLKGTKMLMHYLHVFARQLDQAQAFNDVKALTYKDDLTDLYNQRYLPMILEQELSRASRGHHEFSVLFLDVDFFKLVNDTKGHLVGSQVLVELSRLFKQSIRSTDFAFRYGGDEYVIVLSGANSKNAMLVAERLRKKTAETVFSINGNQVKVTVSIGIATYPEHARSTQELINMADEAMYVGKNKSRNIVYMAS